jgi:predicted nucleic acid-binding protein
MVIVDTTVWIDYLRGTQNPETLWLDRELTRQRLGLTDLILCEVLQGVREPAQFVQVKKELLKFQVFDSVGADLAISAAKNSQELRQQGHTVRSTIDWLIATFCLFQGHSLLHRDRDFNVFERVLGLKVIRP